MAFGLIAAGAAAITLDPFNVSVSADPPAPPVAVQNGGITRVKTSPLDTPLRLLSQAKEVYSRVQDYTCTMIRQERLRGQLQPENVVALKFRKQPFSVYMQWQAPRQFAGQEVCYVHGHNDNMMRVRSKGLLGAIGFISIAPNDPRVLEHSRHIITETGIGNLIERLFAEWSNERERNNVRVQVSEYEFDRRRCDRIEVVRTQRVQGDASYRTILYIDKKFHLPVRIEVYDWPRQGGSQLGELREVYSYVNMRFNTGLTDREFNY